MKNNLNVFWDIEATKHLREIYKYIKKSSPEGAKKVRDEIFDVIKNSQPILKCFLLMT